MPMYEAQWLSDNKTVKHTLHISATTLEDAMCIAKVHAKKSEAVAVDMYEAGSKYPLLFMYVDEEESE